MESRIEKKVSSNTILIIIFGVIILIMVTFLVLWIIIFSINRNTILNPDRFLGKSCNCKGVSADYEINVISKTFSNPFFSVNKEERPVLNLKVDTPYTFKNESSCDHPFYISTSSKGQSEGVVTEGVVYSEGNYKKVCDGAFLIFTPTESQKGSELYYQCVNHPNMGNRINIS